MRFSIHTESSIVDWLDNCPQHSTKASVKSKRACMGLCKTNVVILLVCKNYSASWNTKFTFKQTDTHTNNKGTHLLQRHWGSTVVSERPTEARKAKGQASSIMNAAMSRRMGNSVTVINAICKRLRKREKGKKLNTSSNTLLSVIWIMAPLQSQLTLLYAILSNRWH